MQLVLIEDPVELREALAGSPDDEVVVFGPPGAVRVLTDDDGLFAALEYFAAVSA
jgi:hypothetical protein